MNQKLNTIKAILFDLDGVLVESRNMHYIALNKALASIDEKYTIEREEHLSTFDGLPTTKKLQKLTELKGLPKDMYDEVWSRKQQATIETINEEYSPDFRLIKILKDLKKMGFKMCVCSNSIRETTRMILIRKGLMEFMEFYVTNEDVMNPKPNPEMYLKAMIGLNVSPKECVIVEDSHIGRKAALSSGAHLCAVMNSEDLDFEKINKTIMKAIEKGKIKPKWQGGKMKVLIPMAGAGSRFANAGYTFPKPLIEVRDKPMIQTIVDNLNIDAEHIFIVQKSHYEKYNLKEVLSIISPDCKIVQVDGVTEGAACTTLLAKEYINNNEPLLIANSDQYVEWDSNEFMYSMIGDGIDGGILTFYSTHPKWSYVKLNNEGYVIDLQEKKPISDKATVGIYFWGKGSDYVKYAEQMIENDTRVNGEFYVAPVYNEAIKENKKIKIFDIKKMWGLGTPEDLDYFLKYQGAKGNVDGDNDTWADAPNPNE
jgi:HAD superfamily hydrolase (TIGR01509 family)